MKDFKERKEALCKEERHYLNTVVLCSSSAAVAFLGVVAWLLSKNWDLAAGLFLVCGGFYVQHCAANSKGPFRAFEIWDDSIKKKKSLIDLEEQWLAGERVMLYFGDRLREVEFHCGCPIPKQPSARLASRSTEAPAVAASQSQILGDVSAPAP
jgi:hypothetical protein